MTPEENDRSTNETPNDDNAVSPLDSHPTDSPQNTNGAQSTSEQTRFDNSPKRPNFGAGNRSNGAPNPRFNTNGRPPFPPNRFPPRPLGFGSLLLKDLLATTFGVGVFCAFCFLTFCVGLATLVELFGGDGSTSELVAEEVVSGSDDAAGKIVILPVEGIIETDEWGFLREAVDIIRDDERVRGLVLRVNSPGGTVSGSDYYLRLLKDLKKELDIPIVVSMGDVAASGGYYISTVADKIFAERSTETGSIGVIIPMYDASALCEKLGIGSTPVVSGPMKGMGDFMKKPTPEERAIFQSLVDENYEQFLDVVREGRPWFQGTDENSDAENAETTETAQLSENASDVSVPENVRNDETTALAETDETVAEALVPEEIENVATPADASAPDDRNAQLRKIADGRVYTARQAKELHLIDEIGFLDDAVAEAISLASLDSDSVQVVRFVETESWVDSLGLAAESNATSKRLGKAAKALAAPKAYYLAPRALPIDE